jgi:hypothetical protein
MVLMMETVHTSETTGLFIPEESHLRTLCGENLKSHTVHLQHFRAPLCSSSQYETVPVRRLLTVLPAVFHLHYMALRLWKWDPKALDLGIAATLTSRRQFWFENKDSQYYKQPTARPHFSVVHDEPIQSFCGGNFEAEPHLLLGTHDAHNYQHTPAFTTHNVDFNGTM